MGRFILCVSQPSTNNVLRYIHQLKKSKNLIFAKNTGSFPWGSNPLEFEFSHESSSSATKTTPSLLSAKRDIWPARFYLKLTYPGYVNLICKLQLLSPWSPKKTKAMSYVWDWTKIGFLGSWQLSTSKKLTNCGCYSTEFSYIGWQRFVRRFEMWRGQIKPKRWLLVACLLVARYGPTTFSPKRCWSVSSNQQASNKQPTYQKPKNTIVQNLVFRCPSRIF